MWQVADLVRPGACAFALPAPAIGARLLVVALDPVYATRVASPRYLVALGSARSSRSSGSTGNGTGPRRASQKGRRHDCSSSWMRVPKRDACQGDGLHCSPAPAAPYPRWMVVVVLPSQTTKKMGLKLTNPMTADGSQHYLQSLVRIPTRRPLKLQMPRKLRHSQVPIPRTLRRCTLRRLTLRGIPLVSK